MELQNARTSYLMARFEAFHRELVRQRRSVEAGSRFSGEALSQRAISPADKAEEVWQQLLSALERQEQQASEEGGAFGLGIYREAQYVMAALADEVFLHINWPGRDSWVLLESRLFQTHMAGELIFQRIDKVLKQPDPFYRDMAAVYFMALALGFQGKFRDRANKSELNEYQKRLFQFLYGRDARLAESTAPLFPDAIQNVIDDGAGKKLPDQRIWLWLIVIVLALWLGISHFGWRSLSQDVRELIAQALGSPAPGTQGGRP